MPVNEKWMYEANDGSFWPNKEAAQHHNGILALKKHLDPTESFTQADVLEEFQTWYITYLEGQKS